MNHRVPQPSAIHSDPPTDSLAEGGAWDPSIVAFTVLLQAARLPAAAALLVLSLPGPLQDLKMWHRLQTGQTQLVTLPYE